MNQVTLLSSKVQSANARSINSIVHENQASAPSHNINDHLERQFLTKIIILVCTRVRSGNIDLADSLVSESIAGTEYYR